MGFFDNIGGELDMVKEDERISRENVRVFFGGLFLVVVLVLSFQLKHFAETYSPACQHDGGGSQCDGGRWSQDMLDKIKAAN